MDEAAEAAAVGASQGWVTGDDAQALEALDLLYGDEFMIGRDGQGWWAARRHKPGTGMLRADDPEKLATLMNGEEPS